MSDFPDNAGSVLVVEDDPDFADSIEMILEGEGYEVTLCDDGSEGYELASGDAGFDAVITDYRLPGMGGLELLRQLKETRPRRPVILMTAHGNTELAIEATKRGAFDYLLKPFDVDELIDTTGKAVNAGRAMQKPVKLPGEIAAAGEASIIGNSRPMQSVYKEIGKIAPTHTTVLILGETGTGKELVARAIYQHSDRGDGSFIAVNCGAIPENLLESELFGHVKGAFTGATANRIGRFEQADGGTLFLDEIGDMPMAVQVKLLRVLQERKIQPLGDSREIAVDVRVIAATHQNLEKRIQADEFREDLFYRINSAVVSLPPLRERTDDIGPLIEHFAGQAAAEFGVPLPELSKAVLERLAADPWPGNVRQLQNAVRHIVLHSGGYAVTGDLVEAALSQSAGPSGGDEEGGSPTLDDRVRRVLEAARKTGSGQAHAELVEEVERKLIAAALKLSGGHLGKVTEWLGISRVTLRKKMGDYGLGGKEDTQELTG